jgi:hypothetical protein
LAVREAEELKDQTVSLKKKTNKKLKYQNSNGKKAALKI